MSQLWVLAIPVVVVAVPLAVLTAIGQHRRTHRIGLSLLAGVCFPAVWIGWYVRDDLRRARSCRAPGRTY